MQKIVGNRFENYSYKSKCCNLFAFAQQTFSFTCYFFFALEVGDQLLNSKADDSKEQQLRALEEAVERAEARATKELKAALKRLREEKEEERKRALDKQKQVGRLSMYFYVRIQENYNEKKKFEIS